MHAGQAAHSHTSTSCLVDTTAIRPLNPGLAACSGSISVLLPWYPKNEHSMFLPTLGGPTGQTRSLVTAGSSQATIDDRRMLLSLQIVAAAPFYDIEPTLQLQQEP